MSLIKYLSKLRDETKRDLIIITAFLITTNSLAGIGQYQCLKKIERKSGQYASNLRATQTLTSGRTLTNFVTNPIAGGGKIAAMCYLLYNQKEK